MFHGRLPVDGSFNIKQIIPYRALEIQSRHPRDLKYLNTLVGIWSDFVVWWNHYRETSTSLHSKPRAQEVKEILDEIQIEIETNRNATRNQETISVGQARIKRWFCMGFEKLPDFLFSLRLQKFFVTKQPVISFR